MQEKLPETRMHSGNARFPVLPRPELGADEVRGSGLGQPDRKPGCADLGGCGVAAHPACRVNDAV